MTASFCVLLVLGMHAASSAQELGAQAVEKHLAHFPEQAEALYLQSLAAFPTTEQKSPAAMRVAANYLALLDELLEGAGYPPMPPVLWDRKARPTNTQRATLRVQVEDARTAAIKRVTLGAADENLLRSLMADAQDGVRLHDLYRAHAISQAVVRAAQKSGQTATEWELLDARATTDMALPVPGSKQGWRESDEEQQVLSVLSAAVTRETAVVKKAELLGTLLSALLVNDQPQPDAAFTLDALLALPTVERFRIANDALERAAPDPTWVTATSAPLFVRACDAATATLKPPHVELGRCRLAVATIAAGRTEDVAAKERALEDAMAMIPPDDPQRVVAMEELASLYLTTHRSIHALPLLRQALTLSQTRFGTTGQPTIQLHGRMAELMKVRADKQGLLDAGEAYIQAAKARGPWTEDHAYFSLSLAYAELELCAQARDLGQRSRRIRIEGGRDNVAKMVEERCRRVSR